MRPWRGSNPFASRPTERRVPFDLIRAAATRSVLLHGGPGMGDYFDAFPEVLSPPYRVVSYNQRGCGPSFCDGSFEVEKQVADLDAIRTHLNAEKRHPSSRVSRT